MSDVLSEKVIRVFSEGHFIEVGGSSIAPGLVELRTVGPDNCDFFGSVSINVQPAFARALAKALNEVADFEEGK